MNAWDWIICERTSRWAAAVRVALERESTAELRAARVVEVRNHRDLESRLSARPDALVTIEVERANLAAVLAWLGTAGPRYPRATFVAVLDRLFVADQNANGDVSVPDVEQALVEAGAMLVVRLPRAMKPLLDLAQRHAARAAAAADGELSPVERVWASLPWQDG